MVMKLNPITGEFDIVAEVGGVVGSTSFATDAGTATPTAGGVITIAGGTGVNTSGAANTVTVNIDSPVTVANGGTGQTSYTDGQLLIGNSTGNTLDKATLTGGSGITITNGSGTIQISSSVGSFTWNEITAASETMSVENGYIANRGTLVTLTLPATAAIGDTIKIVGKGAGLFKIAQNAGQTVHIVASSTTTGVGGSLTAIEQFDGLELVCTSANTDFTVIHSNGNYTVV